MGILEDMRDLLVNIDKNVAKIAGGNGPKPPNKDWPNLPTGFKKITEWDMSGDPPATSDGSTYIDEPIPGSNGWRAAYNHTPGTMYPDDPSYGVWANTPYGYGEAVPDPDFAKKIYRHTYPEGMREGNAGITMYLAWPINTGPREFYAGYWWKPSADFDLSNNGSKMCFMFNGGGGAGGQIFITFSGSKQVCVMPEYEPHDDPNVPYYIRYPNKDQKEVTLGEWHQIEWYVNLDTHIIRWWVDAVLTGDFDDLVPNNYNFDMYQFSPTYGGCCSHNRPNTCEYYFRDCVVAIPDTVKGIAAKKPMKFIKLPKDYKLPVHDPWPKEHK